jgi:hypothetical protein
MGGEASHNKIIMDEKKSLPVVTLLFHDWKKAETYSAIFREMGVIPEFFDNLKDFWMAHLVQSPHLSLIEVNALSDLELSLLDHPKLKTNDWNVAFVANSTNLPLVCSLGSIPHCGVIWDEVDFGRAQLQGILKRLNEVLKKDQEIASLRSEIAKVNNRKESLVTENNRWLAQKKVFQSALGVARELSHSSSINFHEKMAKVFDAESACLAYTVYQLNQDGTKLYCPQLSSKKYEKLSSLWLGEVCDQGIKTFAENMAYQVVLEELSGPIVLLKVRSFGSLPDYLIFISTKEIFKEDYPWFLIEEGLSKALIQSSQKDSPSLLSLEWNPYKLFDFLDREYFQGSGNYSFLTIDFSSLLKVISDHPFVSFDWHQFNRDFVSQCSNFAQEDFNFCFLNVRQMVVVINSKDSVLFKTALQRLVRSFDFFRYFQDPDLIFKTSIELDVLDGFTTLKEVRIEKNISSQNSATRITHIEGP